MSIRASGPGTTEAWDGRCTCRRGRGDQEPGRGPAWTIRLSICFAAEDVIPAKAGTQCRSAVIPARPGTQRSQLDGRTDGIRQDGQDERDDDVNCWIPAFAGMTKGG